MQNKQDQEGALTTGLGFAFVRGFLWWMLAIFAVLLGVMAFLSWYFAMDISVRASGQIRPAAHRQVKVAIGGIIREIWVREGDRVAVGETLAVLDDAEWRLRQAKLARELAANRLRVDEVKARFSEDRQLRQLAAKRARVELHQSTLGLEQVRAEQQVGAVGLLSCYGWKRKPLAELWPVRQARAVVGQRRADLAEAVARLQLVDGQLRELKSLAVAYAELLQDQAYLTRQLAQTVILAPDDGVVLTRDIAKRVGDQIGAGEILLEIAAGEGWVAEVAVAERDLPRVEIGQWTRVYVEAYPHMEHRIFDGAVRAMGQERAVGGGYPVRVALDDSALLTGVYRLAPGMQVEARIVVERGRIAELAWVRLMRSLGKVHKGDLYVATTL